PQAVSDAARLSGLRRQSGAGRRGGGEPLRQRELPGAIKGIDSALLLAWSDEYRRSRGCAGGSAGGPQAGGERGGPVRPDAREADDAGADGREIGEQFATEHCGIEEEPAAARDIRIGNPIRGGAYGGVPGRGVREHGSNHGGERRTATGRRRGGA